MELLKTLNPQQKKAVTFGSGPLLIVAGAGTGKTTVITQRLAWLMKEGKAKADEILALTFTDKAAGEMEERVDQLLAGGYLDLWVSTFHSFGERLLKEHALEIGLDSGFKLLSQTDQWRFIRRHLDEFELDYYKPLGNPTRFIYALIKHFSRAKDENVLPQDYLAYAKKLEKNPEVPPEEKNRVRELARAYETYQRLLVKEGFLDFGDLIIYPLKLFRERERILNYYRDKFKYLLIDEFQDTNFAQYELVKLLAAPKNNLTVVGDDDQSIFKFRGASISNILEFKKDFPKCQEVLLVKNYRSRQNILDLAYDFIQLNNPYRLEHQLKGVRLDNRGRALDTKISKKLRATKKAPRPAFAKASAGRPGSGQTPRFHSGQAIIEELAAKTQADEAKMVLEKILELRKKDEALNWSDFAILVRANDQANLFTNLLASQEVPFQFIANRGLYLKPEIMDLIAYLKMLDNYHENSALYRVLAMPIFGFENLDLMNLLNYANRRNFSIYEAMTQAQAVPGLSLKGLKAIAKLLLMIKKHTELAKKKSASLVLFRFAEDSGYLKSLTSRRTIGNADKILNINQFFKQLEEFEQENLDKSVKNFIESINLELEAGEEGRLSAEALLEGGPDSVRVMTIHSAKGLEFTYVFLVGLVDKRFPTIERREPIELPLDLIKEIVPEGDIHLQEERRLFYVGMTRAKEGLFFTLAEDYGGARKKRPSRFLSELDLSKVTRQAKPEIAQGQFNFGPEVKKEWKKYKMKFERLPNRFSFTQLKAFETCPYQYRLAHILRVPTKGRHTFSFGKSIHNTLREFYQALKDGQKVSLKTLLEIYEHSWIGDWYDSKKHEAERKAAGEKALRGFFKTNEAGFKPPLYLEQGFNVKIKDYTLKGKIDRVDDLGRGELEIIDYKTGRLPKNDKEIDLEQLLIYAMAVKEVFRGRPAELSYYYLEADKKISFPFQEEELAKIKKRVMATIEEIQQSDFKATPSVFKCQNCDFKEICEWRA